MPRRACRREGEPAAGWAEATAAEATAAQAGPPAKAQTPRAPRSQARTRIHRARARPTGVPGASSDRSPARPWSRARPRRRHTSPPASRVCLRPRTPGEPRGDHGLRHPGTRCARRTCAPRAPRRTARAWSARARDPRTPPRRGSSPGRGKRGGSVRSPRPPTRASPPRARRLRTPSPQWWPQSLRDLHAAPSRKSRQFSGRRPRTKKHWTRC